MTAVEELSRLRTRLEEAEEKLRWYEEMFSSLEQLCPAEWRLSKLEGRMMAALVRAGGRTVTYANLCTVVWGGEEPDGGADNLRTYAYRIKKKVAPHGLTLVPDPGRGYYVRRTT